MTQIYEYRVQLHRISLCWHTHDVTRDNYLRFSHLFPACRYRNEILSPIRTHPSIFRLDNCEEKLIVLFLFINIFLPLFILCLAYPCFDNYNFFPQLVTIFTRKENVRDNCDRHIHIFVNVFSFMFIFVFCLYFSRFQNCFNRWKLSEIIFSSTGETYAHKENVHVNGDTYIYIHTFSLTFRYLCLSRTRAFLFRL